MTYADAHTVALAAAAAAAVVAIWNHATTVCSTFLLAYLPDKARTTLHGAVCVFFFLFENRAILLRSRIRVLLTDIVHVTASASQSVDIRHTTAFGTKKIFSAISPPHSQFQPLYILHDAHDDERLSDVGCLPHLDWQGRTWSKPSDNVNKLSQCDFRVVRC